MEAVSGSNYLLFLPCLARRSVEVVDTLAQEALHNVSGPDGADKSFPEIVGCSSSLKVALGQAKQVAGTDSTVLLLGETGTGKELVAQAIHRLSSRRDRAFVRADCA